MLRATVLLVTLFTLIAKPAGAQNFGRVPERVQMSRSMGDHPAASVVSEIIAKRFGPTSISRFTVKRSDGGVVSDAVRQKYRGVQQRVRRDGARRIDVEYEMLASVGDTLSFLVKESNLSDKKGDQSHVSTYWYRLVPKDGTFVLIGRLMIATQDYLVGRIRFLSGAPKSFVSARARSRCLPAWHQDRARARARAALRPKWRFHCAAE